MPSTPGSVDSAYYSSLGSVKPPHPLDSDDVFDSGDASGLKYYQATKLSMPGSYPPSDSDGQSEDEEGLSQYKEGLSQNDGRISQDQEEVLDRFRDLILSEPTIPRRSGSNFPTSSTSTTSSSSDISHAAVDSPTPKGRRSTQHGPFTRKISTRARTKEDILEGEKQHWDSLNKIIPLQPLDEKSKHCMGATKQGKQCRNKKGPSCNAYCATDLFDDLEGLAGLAFCKSHLDEANESLLQFKELPGLHDHGYFDDEGRAYDKLSAFVKWVNRLKAEEVLRAICGKGSGADVIDKKEKELEPSGFMEYNTRGTADKSAIQLVQSELRLINRLLTDRMEGTIYVIWAPSSPRYVKIGRTKRDALSRISEHQARCERYFQDCIHESKKKKHDKVPYINYVERLIFAELHEFRRVAICKACAKYKKQDDGVVRHREWFEVHPDIAVKVVRKWVDWMRNQVGGYDRQVELGSSGIFG